MEPVVLITIMATVLMTIMAVLLLFILKRKKTLTAAKTVLINRGTGLIDGQAYTWHKSPAAQNKNPSFQITLPCSHTGRFTLRRETGFDRLGKRLGLASEVSTYDENFDQRTYVSTPHPAFTGQLLSRSTVRNSIRKLLERGFTAIRLSKSGLSAVWMPYRPKDRAVTDEELPELAAELHELLKAAERVPPGEEDLSRQRSWQRKLTGLYVFASLATLIGIAGLIAGLTAFTPLDPGRIFLQSLRWTVPAMLLFCWLAYILLRGNSDAHGHMLGLIFLSLSAFLMLGFGGTTFLNGYLDRSEAVPHSTRVVHKYYTKSKNNYTYHLELSSWRRDRETENQTVSRSFYEKMVPNESRLTVISRAGRFGFEWIESLRVESF